MKSILCEVVYSEDFGTVGIVPQAHWTWYTSNDAYNPLTGIGHDVIDHFAHDQNGSIEHELTAYGSILYSSNGLKNWIDGSGRFRNDNMHTGTRSDFSSFLGEAFKSIDEIEIEECNYKVSNKVLNYVDSVMTPVLLENEDFIKYTLDYFQYEDKFSHDDMVNAIKKEWSNIIKWVAYGYTKAKKRYSKYDPYDLLVIKHAINQAGNNVTKEYIGETVRLRYNITEGTAEYYHKNTRI